MQEYVQAGVMQDLSIQEINEVNGGLAPIVFIAIAVGAGAMFDFTLNYYFG